MLIDTIREGRLRRRPSRRLLLVAALVTAFLSACDGTPDDPGSSLPTDGPVQFPGRKILQRAGMEARQGHQVIFGALTIENRGDASANLSAGRLLGDVDPTTAAVSEVRIIDLGKIPGSGDLLGASGWPNPDYRKWWRQAEQLEGAQLEAGQAAEVVFLVDVHKTGEWYWPKTAIDYDVNGDEYTAVTNFGFQVCPPAPDPCSDLETSD